MNTFLGIIGPIGIIGISLLYIVITLFSLNYLMKNEKGLQLLIWLLLILFVPFIGPLIYLSNYFIKIKTNSI